MAVRLQKVLAAAGIGSRRACEQLILAGRVTVNRQKAILGSRVDPHQDEIRVDGERISNPEPTLHAALYKPVGYLSSLRSQGGLPTVRELIELPGRLYPVGRLDLDSEGLILLTNDGELANRLTHPRFEVEKEYRVLLVRLPDPKQLAAWQRGVVLPDGSRTLPATVSPEGEERGQSWVRVVMREGRKRQIRELAQVLGLTVKRLIRVRIGALQLGKLSPGQWRPLERSEVQALMKATAKGKDKSGAFSRRRSIGGRTGGAGDRRASRRTTGRHG